MYAQWLLHLPQLLPLLVSTFNGMRSAMASDILTNPPLYPSRRRALRNSSSCTCNNSLLFRPSFAISLSVDHGYLMIGGVLDRHIDCHALGSFAQIAVGGIDLGIKRRLPSIVCT